MTKSKKLFLSLLLIVLMLLAFSCVVAYQYEVMLPFEFLPFTMYPIVGSSLAVILFWLAVIVGAVCLALLLIVLFSPRELSWFKLHEDHGALVIDKKAIQGFTKAILETEDFISPPKVKVSMTKHKIKIKIIGDLKRTSELYDKSDVLIQRIQNELTHLLGLKQTLFVQVFLQDYQEQEPKTARVI